MARSRRRLTRTICALGALGLGAAAPTAAGAHPAKPAALAAPSGLTIAATKYGLALFWAGTGSTFQVEQASDATMDTGVVSYTIHNGYKQFSPPDLSAGQTAFFRVRARSGSKASAYTSTVSAAPTTDQQPVRVMTYNILEASTDGHHEGGNTIAPWSERRIKAASLVRSQAPDVIAIEEGWPWIGPVANRVRQVDSLAAALGSPYQVAPTEKTYPTKGWFRTGDYIIYNSSKYALGQRRGHFDIGQAKYGAYQVLINRSSGARFLFIATHLVPGTGSSLEATRQKETGQLFTKGHQLAVELGLPVIYAGDFNSATATDVHFTYDSTAKSAAHFGNDDAFFVAPSLSNGSYDSANLYHHKPPRSSDRIDRIFASPGVAVVRAGITLHLTNGLIAGVIPSDHNPLWADLEFPYPAGTS